MKILIKNFGVFILLFFILFLAFPFLFTFERKMFWDITLINLPWRYHLSESINNGYLPLWNPYINNGFPQMGHYETWYPISWLIALLFKYDLRILQYEYLLHLFIAAVGFYKLTSLFSNLSKPVRLSGAITYMLCGLFISQASHLGYIISGAWMTFVFYYLFQFIKTPSWRIGLNLLLVYVFLLSGGYPGNSIIITYICLVILLYHFIKIIRAKNYVRLKKSIIISVSLSFFFLVIMSVVIYNVYDLQYYITRQDLEYTNVGFGAMTGSNSFASYISLVLPTTTSVKHDFWQTSAMLNNAYIGILFSILPIFYIIFGSKQKFYKSSLLLFVIGLFFLLTSVAIQFPLHKLLYNIIPLLNKFRFPSIYRIFFIACWILVSLQGLNLIINHKKYRTKFIIWLIGILVIALFSLLILPSIYLPELFTEFDTKIKSYSLKETVFIDVSFLIILLSAAILLLRFKTKKLNQHLLLLISIDILVHVWLITPKFVSTNQNPQLIDSSIAKIPKGFPLIQNNISIKNNHLLFKNSPSLWLNKHSYNKYPCILGSSPYSTISYHNAIKNNNYDTLIKYPFLPIFDSLKQGKIDTLYYNEKLTNTVTSLFTSPNEFDFIIKDAQNKFVVFNHNKYKYWNFYENNIKLKPTEVNTNALAIKLKSSDSNLKIKFEPETTIQLFYISTLGLIVLLVLCFSFNIKWYVKNKGN